MPSYVTKFKLLSCNNWKSKGSIQWLWSTPLSIRILFSIHVCPLEYYSFALYVWLLVFAIILFLGLNRDIFVRLRLHGKEGWVIILIPFSLYDSLGASWLVDTSSSSISWKFVKVSNLASYVNGGYNCAYSWEDEVYSNLFCFVYFIYRKN